MSGCSIEPCREYLCKHYRGDRLEYCALIANAKAYLADTLAQGGPKVRDRTRFKNIPTAPSPYGFFYGRKAHA